ncbi:MAG: uroporphyrinogen decarboxylase family protein [bacterium]
MNTTVTTSNQFRKKLTNNGKNVPVFFPDQGGSYHPDCKRMVGREGRREIIHSPDLHAEYAMIPVDTLGVDAAVIHTRSADLLEGMGFDVQFNPGKLGAFLSQPINLNGTSGDMPISRKPPGHSPDYPP